MPAPGPSAGCPDPAESLELVENGKPEAAAGEIVESPETIPEMTDASELMSGMAVPMHLQDRPCHARTAGSIQAAYNAVRNLGAFTIAVPPWRPTWELAYPAGTFLAGLEYDDRPLVPYDRWAELLAQVLISPEQTGDARAAHLKEHGFDEVALAKIWQQPARPGARGEGQRRGRAALHAGDPARRPHRSPGRGPQEGHPAAATAQRDARSELQGMVDLIWHEIYLHSDRWYGRSLTEIASAIYDRCYIAFEDPRDIKETCATKAHVEYVESVQRLFQESGHSHPAVDVPRERDTYNAGIWYAIGNLVGVRHRLYVHARRDTALQVMGHVTGMIGRDRVVGAKLASLPRAGERPDTIVIYLASEGRPQVLEIAQRLGHAVSGCLDAEVPGFATRVCDGIGVGWDPPPYLGLSFGEYYAGLFAEALYDAVANASSAGIEVGALRDGAIGFLRHYGLDPDRPTAAPGELADGKPPNARETPPKLRAAVPLKRRPGASPVLGSRSPVPGEASSLGREIGAPVRRTPEGGNLKLPPMFSREPASPTGGASLRPAERSQPSRTAQGRPPLGQLPLLPSPGHTHGPPLGQLPLLPSPGHAHGPSSLTQLPPPPSWLLRMDRSAHEPLRTAPSPLSSPGRMGGGTRAAGASRVPRPGAVADTSAGGRDAGQRGGNAAAPGGPAAPGEALSPATAQPPGRSPIPNGTPTPFAQLPRSRDNHE